MKVQDSVSGECFDDNFSFIVRSEAVANEVSDFCEVVLDSCAVLLLNVVLRKLNFCQLPLAEFLVCFEQLVHYWVVIFAESFPVEPFWLHEHSVDLILFLVGGVDERVAMHIDESANCRQFFPISLLSVVAGDSRDEHVPLICDEDLQGTRFLTQNPQILAQIPQFGTQHVELLDLLNSCRFLNFLVDVGAFFLHAQGSHKA